MKKVLDQLEEHLIAVLICAMVVFETVNAVFHAAGAAQTGLPEELAIYCYIWIAFLSAAFCAKKGCDVAVNMLSDRYSANVRHLVKIVCAVINLAMSVCLLMGAFQFVTATAAAIGDMSTKSMTDTASLTSALLGEEGTTTTITYLTPDRQEQTVDLVHSNYRTTTVSSQMIGDTCGYVRIDAFSSGTASEFRSAVDNLLNQGAASFIFDVRDNIGENLNAALVCADYCVPSGVIAQQEDKDGNITLLRMSDENEVTVPMVVLVNGSTYDGAELFANALRKMNSATIVGTRTAGKGVVMSDAQRFSDCSAAYISIGLLLDNEGQSWNDLGLTPDVDAALSSDEQNAYYDYTVDTD